MSRTERRRSGPRSDRGFGIWYRRQGRLPGSSIPVMTGIRPDDPGARPVLLRSPGCAAVVLPRRRRARHGIPPARRRAGRQISAPGKHGQDRLRSDELLASGPGQFGSGSYHERSPQRPVLEIRDRMVGQIRLKRRRVDGPMPCRQTGRPACSVKAGAVRCASRSRARQSATGAGVAAGSLAEDIAHFITTYGGDTSGCPDSRPGRRERKGEAWQLRSGHADA